MTVDDGAFFQEIRVYDVAGYPGVRIHIVRNRLGDMQAIMSGGTREQRDEVKQIMNLLLAAGKRPQIDFLDEEDGQRVRVASVNPTELQKISNDE
jgi:hypothetical protein